MKKNEKGITLIALVITIIVLIILAAVSIAMLTGNSGIISNATGAKQETLNGQADEAEKMLFSQWKIYKETTENPTVEEFLKEYYGFDGNTSSGKVNVNGIDISVSKENGELNINQGELEEDNQDSTSSRKTLIIKGMSGVCDDILLEYDDGMKWNNIDDVAVTGPKADKLSWDYAAGGWNSPGFEEQGNYWYVYAVYSERTRGGTL